MCMSQGIYQHGVWHAWSQRLGPFSACHLASRDAWKWSDGEMVVVVVSLNTDLELPNLVPVNH